MNIFVQRAADCLTDHLPHGEGLICYSLLDGLARRGHTIFAATGESAIRGEKSGNLHVRELPERSPANSLLRWERSLRADRWLAELVAGGTRIDLVWRMNPNGPACPRPPRTLGRPLVLGPLYYEWPAAEPAPEARPRWGLGIGAIAEPLARRGWNRTLHKASLIFCATRPHAEQVGREAPAARAVELPAIVDPPRESGTDGHKRPAKRGPRLVFVANLAAQKNPRVFCDTVGRLRAAGVLAEGTIVGDGPQRPELQAYCERAGIAGAVTFAGRVGNGEVFRHVSNADFLVSTSLGEPYGRNIVEAMSVGTPAVCHRSGGPADIIADGDDGILIGELTASAYADGIMRAIRRPDHFAAMSAAARAKSEGWSTERVMTHLESELSRLVAEDRT